MTPESDGFYRRVFESLDEYAIFTIDLTGIVTSANRGVEKLLGFDREEFVGSPSQIIFTAEDRKVGAPQLEMKVARETGHAADDRWHLKADGSLIWVNGVMSHVVDDQGELIGFVKVLRDRTAERRIQERLRESEANYRAAASELARARDELESQVRERTADLMGLNEELESFNYSVSHDLRAPLRGLTGFSQILLEEYSDSLDETGRNYLQRISASAEHMGELIDALLDLSRVSSVELRVEDVDLSELARMVLARFRENEPERVVEIHVQPGVRGRGDERLLELVLENLLGNAWKFTSESSLPSIWFGAQEKEGTTCYYVRDNGSGFEMAYSEKLFAPFQRLHSPRHYSGLGIGLATVHRIIDRHGGSIWGEAEPGSGASFHFTLAPDSL